ncbi:MAG TPA: VWA domain-containing protein [Terriglobia bacterium]|nr:VWA domain-containing protein [Terriglobia bacterium]
MLLRRARAVAAVGLAVAAQAVLFTAYAAAQGGVDGSPPVVPAKPSSAPARQDISPQIRVQSTLVTTPVTVINHSGEFVSDLDPNYFKVFDNGVAQRIERFEIGSDVVALVILVQTNDSVASLLGQVRPLGPVFSDLLLGPDGQAAVMTFSDRVQLLQKFGGDPEGLKRSLDSLQNYGGKARMNDAIMQALAALETRPKSERRIIVVFSDGNDHGSENNKADVIRRATNDETTIYGLHLSRTEAELLDKPDQGQPMDPLDANVTRPTAPGTVPTSTNASDTWGTPIPGIPIITALGETVSSELLKNALEQYAGYTGGVYYSHWSKTKLQDQLNRICSEVHTQYELAYAPSTLSEAGFHRIVVRVDKPGLKVRSRAGYFYQSR